MDGEDCNWFTRFPVDSDDEPDGEVVWADSMPVVKTVRKPTGVEKFSILLVGALAVALLIGMVVTLIIGVYVSRR